MDEGRLLLGRYETQSLIGEGGYGKVYKARQTSTGQWVAVKVLSLDHIKSRKRLDEVNARFQREMELVARLRHPNIVTLIDSGLEEETRIMVMEYVDGENLQQRLARGPLDIALTRRVFLQILDALAEAHAKGVIHRDLKPGNIMLSGRENRPTVKVLDFGIARVCAPVSETEARPLTQQGAVLGTPSYLAPEIVLGKPASAASDLYAIGLLMAECLAARRMIEGENSVQTFMKHVHEPLVLPEHIANSVLGPVIERACAKDPAQRFASVDELHDLLDELDCSEAERLGRPQSGPSVLPEKRHEPEEELAFASTQAMRPFSNEPHRETPKSPERTPIARHDSGAGFCATSALELDKPQRKTSSETSKSNDEEQPPSAPIVLLNNKPERAQRSAAADPSPGDRKPRASSNPQLRELEARAPTVQTNARIRVLTLILLILIVLVVLLFSLR